MENKEEVGGVLILDKWSISFQTFPKVEAYADIANTSFEFPCSLEIFYQMKTNHDVLTQRVSVEWVVFARREDKEN